MLDQTLLMQTLKDIADTGERLSNQSEENAFVVIAEAFKNVGAEVEIERVPLFVSTVDRVSLKADGQSIEALGNAMTLPLDGEIPDKLIFEMADLSYDTVVKKLPKYLRRRLESM